MLDFIVYFLCIFELITLIFVQYQNIIFHQLSIQLFLMMMMKHRIYLKFFYRIILLLINLLVYNLFQFIQCVQLRYLTHLSLIDAYRNDRNNDVQFLINNIWNLPKLGHLFEYTPSLRYLNINIEFDVNDERIINYKLYLIYHHLFIY